MKNGNNLFYTCSLIEYIGRKTKNKRKDLIMNMRPDIRRIYSHADEFHCEPIEKVSDVSGISYFSDFPSCANNLVRLIFILFS